MSSPKSSGLWMMTPSIVSSEVVIWTRSPGFMAAKEAEELINFCVFFKSGANGCQICHQETATAVSASVHIGGLEILAFLRWFPVLRSLRFLLEECHTSLLFHRMPQCLAELCVIP